MGGKEQTYIAAAFDENWITSEGANVRGFEADLEACLGAGRPVVALSSGTAALHLGLILLGVQPGDEVICQSLTFAASANPIAYLGATPVFVDSEVSTWNMSPVFLEAAIRDRMAKGKKPKAIIPVHLYGMPADMDAIGAIARQYGIPVLEDAAEALGASLHGRMCGTLGDLGVLSFNGNKIITTSGGGALVTTTASAAARCRFLATQARDPAPHYEHSETGYNYRMSNISAGIGRGQMEVLPARVLQRRTNYDRYARLFAGKPGISLLPEPEGCYSNRWLSACLMDPARSGFSREDLRLAFLQADIESRPLWKPLHLQPLYRHAPFYGDGTAARLFEQGLCLPSGSALSDEDWTNIEAVIQEIISNS